VTKYHVHVTREGDQWLADVPELEGSQTYALSLTALDRYVREVIVLGADLPDEAMDDLDLAWRYDIADRLVERANQLRAERDDLAKREAQLQRETEELAVKLTEKGYSVRDTGPLLGVSHQRVSQYRPKNSKDGVQGKTGRATAAHRQGIGISKGGRSSRSKKDRTPAAAADD
jgi:hypothetical protein